MSEQSKAETDSEVCPKCGETTPDDGTNGLCPVCLMAGAMEPTAPDGSSSFEPPSIEAVQAAFPKLEIIEIIGVGGMGVVYKAKQTSLNREVALKLLAPHKEAEAGFSERFIREAQALAAMNHPHIVTVHDFGQADDFFYLIMEFVDGVNIRQAMKAGGFSPEEALVIVPPICDALQYAHDQGIVHRDIKPENLLLDKEGRVKVADFGIARILNMAEPEPAPDAKEIEIDLTGETALGTPNYMAPEQADAPAGVDHRADIYSLGVVFYEMLTGERPSPTMFQPPSSRVGVDVRVDEVVLRALADSPELRWQSATEMRTQVETLADVPKPPPPLLDSETPVQNTVTPAKRKDPWKWVALASGLLSIPFVILGAIALYAVIDDGDWNPNPAEGVFVGALWLGSVVLVIGTVVAFWLSLRKEPREVRIRRIRFAVGMLVVMVGLITPVLTFFVVMQQNSVNASVNFQRIRAEQSLMQSMHQEAHQRRVALSTLENKIATENAAEVSPQLKFEADAIRKQLVEIEKAQAQSQENLSTYSAPSHARPAFGIFILVGGVSLFLLIGGIVLIGKSGGGVAIGCGICLVVLFLFVAGVMAVFVGYNKTRKSQDRDVLMIGETESVQIAQQPIKVTMKTILPSVTPGPQETATFTFNLETDRLPNDWSVWAKTSYYRGGDFKDVATEDRMIGKGGKISIGLRDVLLNPAVMEDLADRFEKRLGTTYLRPGRSMRILNLTDANRAEVRIDLELRPKGVSGKQTLYIRESEAKISYGNITINWNDIEFFDGYDLVLETEGASVFTAGETVDVTRAIDFSRRIVNGEQTLTFTFRPISNFRYEAGFPKPWSVLTLDRDTDGISLFGFNNPQTGTRTSARLKLVPSGSLEEVLPPK